MNHFSFYIIGIHAVARQKAYSTTQAHVACAVAPVCEVYVIKKWLALNIRHSIQRMVVCAVVAQGVGMHYMIKWHIVSNEWFSGAITGTKHRRPCPCSCCSRHGIERRKINDRGVYDVGFLILLGQF